MQDSAWPGREILRALPRTLVEKMQQDLMYGDTHLRQDIVRRLTEVNFGVEATLLSGAIEIEHRGLPSQTAYLLGAYTIIGALLAADEVAQLDSLLRQPSDSPDTIAPPIEKS